MSILNSADINPLTVPRPRDGGGRFVFSSGLSPLSLQEAELGLGPGLGLGEGPSVFRGTRQPQGGYQVT